MSLKDTFKNLLPDDIIIFDYASVEDFNTLWASPATSGRVLIIWKQTPEDPRVASVDTRSHLTPLHWAAAFWKAGMRISICDLQPKAHMGNYLVDHFRSLKPDLIGAVRYFYAGELVEQTSAGETLQHKLFSTGTLSFPLQVTLKRIVAEHIASPLEAESRHALSNIIGPILLSGNPLPDNTISGADVLVKGGIVQSAPAIDAASRPSAADHGSALLALLQSVKLISATAHPRLADAQKRISTLCKKHLPSDAVLRITLVDDQWDAGWFDLLKKIFPHGTKFTVTPDSQFLTDRLTAIGNGNAATYRFNLAPNNSNPSENIVDILFLDLRLGGGGLDRTLFPSDQDYLCALPRMVAQADHSLPVVIFSSTTRKDIVDGLASHPSLITHFSKPAAFQLRSPDEIVECLVMAISQALILAKGRLKCQSLLACLPTVTSPNDAGSTQPFGHFELFIDETKSGSQLTVGGVFAAFDSESDAQSFDDLLVEKGVRYFNSVAGPSPRTGAVLSKDDPCIAQFQDVLSEWRNLGKRIEVGAITLRGINPFLNSGGLLDMDFLDNRWRLAVESIVEVFLSEVVHRLKNEDRLPTVGIYAPTRVSKATGKKEAHSREGRFGVRVQALGNEWGNHAVAPSHLYDIVTNILRNHGLNVDLKIARFFTMAYTNRPAGRSPIPCEEWHVPSSDKFVSLPRGTALNDRGARAELNNRHGNLPEWRASLKALHYVCDSFLFETYHCSASITEINGCAYSVDEPYDVILRGNIAASRFVDTRRLLEAVVAWRPHPIQTTRRNCGTASVLIGARIAHNLEGLTPDEFKEVCRRLEGVKALTIPRIELRGFPQQGVTERDIVSQPDFARNQWGSESPNMVLIREYPENGTLQGLIELGTLGSDNPKGAAIIGNDLDDYSALIWYDTDAAPGRVAQHLRRRGWLSEAAICMDTREEIAEPSVAAAAEAVSHAEQDEVINEWTLVVSGLASDLPLERIRSLIKEAFPAARFANRYWKSRASTKYEARFFWPRSLPLPDLAGMETLEIDGAELHFAFEPRH